MVLPETPIPFRMPMNFLRVIALMKMTMKMVMEATKIGRASCRERVCQYV